MSTTFYKGQISEKDFNYGFSTFQRRNQDGGYEAVPEVIPKYYRQVSEWADFEAAVTALNAAAHTVYLVLDLTMGTAHDVANDITCNSNIYLVANGGILRPAAGKTITVYSPEHIIASPRQQIVDTTNNSTNPLLFTKAGKVYPNWWQENDPGTTNMATAIGLADTCATQVVVKFLSEQYRFTTAIAKSTESKWIGENFDFEDKAESTSYGTTLYTTLTTGDAITITGGSGQSEYHGSMKNMSIRSANNIGSTLTLVRIKGVKKHYFEKLDIRYAYNGIAAEFYDSTYPGQIFITDTYIGYMANDGINLNQTVDVWITRTHSGGTNYGIYLYNCNSIWIMQSRIQNGIQGGLYAELTLTLNIDNNWIDTNGDATNDGWGVYLKDCQGVGIHANKFYDNYGDAIWIESSSTNSNQIVITGNEFHRHGGSTSADKSAIIFLAGNTTLIYRVNISNNLFSTIAMERDFTGRGTLTRGIVVAKNGTGYVDQLIIIGNDFQVADIVYLNNNDIVTGGATADLRSGIFENNNVYNATNIFVNPTLISTSGFVYDPLRNIPPTVWDSADDVGDSDTSVGIYSGDKLVVRYLTDITDNRTVTLLDNNPIGIKIRVARGNAVTAAKNITIVNEAVSTLEVLQNANEWADFEKIASGGSEWIRTAGGTLP